MSKSRINIGHLYPEHTDHFGDRGNVLALYQRACWHGLTPSLIQIRRGEPVNFKEVDLLVMGGLPVAEQEAVLKSLRELQVGLRAAIEEGLVVLAISGSFQLLGKSIPAGPDKNLRGLGILDIYTRYRAGRFTGNAVISCFLWSPPRDLVGFENHTGLTRLRSQVKPLGKVTKGYGNNGRDRAEGAVYKNVIGSNLHGPLLPKNPWLTDYLLVKAMAYRHRSFKPAPLDDEVEIKAHRETAQSALDRQKKNKKPGKRA